MLNTKSLIKKNPIKNIISEEEKTLNLEENIDKFYDTQSLKSLN